MKCAPGQELVHMEVCKGEGFTIAWLGSAERKSLKES